MASWMNNNGDCMPDWKACSSVMEATNGWRRRLVWMSRPSPVVETSCSALRWCGVGYGAAEAADRPWKKTPEILKRLGALLREDTAGDPTGRRGVWTGKRLRTISRELAQLGLRVCPNTVRRLLGELHYALHANRKSLCPSSGPEREQQFHYLSHQRQQFHDSGYPIISVDTKKKELVGQFKNQGRLWSRKPIRVQDHDFRSQAQGMAIPYGIYDLRANRGTVIVGTSHD